MRSPRVSREFLATECLLEPVKPAHIKASPCVLLFVQLTTHPNHPSFFTPRNEMGTGAVAPHSSAGYAHLLDPTRTWLNNKRYFTYYLSNHTNDVLISYHLRLITLNAWIALLLITSSTNGFDGSMMNGLQALPQWKDAFNYPGSSMLGLLNAIQNVGALAGLPFSPYLSDHIGRRASVLLGAAIMVCPHPIKNSPKKTYHPMRHYRSLLPSSKPPPKVLGCLLALVFSLGSVSASLQTAQPCWLPNWPIPPTALL